MKRVLFIYICIAVGLLACSQSPDDQLVHLEGYWEIADVTTPEGQTKTFSISQNIDFFDIGANSKGIRKKVQPSISGKFTTSKSSENIDITIIDGELILTYTTPLDSWKETVIKATQDELILLNENGNTYSYRRYEPLVIK